MTCHFVLTRLTVHQLFHPASVVNAGNFLSLEW